MKKHIIKIIFLPALLYLFLLNSCGLGQPEWELDLSAPLIKGRLDINNLAPGSALVAASDSSITIVYEDELYELMADTLLNIPDTTLSKTVNLQSLTLGSRTIQRDVTLGEVARNAGVAGSYIISSHGSNAVIPPFNDISSGDVDINANSFFQTATFIDGKLEVKFHNGFPIDLTDIEYELRNKSNGTILVNDVINLLPKGADETRTYSLANKTVEGNLVAQIVSMSSPGSNGNPVPIDTSDALTLTIRVYDMDVQSATAIFPAQNLAEEKTDIVYLIGDAKLTRMKLKNGYIRINTVSTIQDSLYIDYAIPNALLGGSPLDVSRIMPPAPPGDSVAVSEDYDVTGYWVDLTGQYGNTYNTFYNELVVRIDSTGKLVPISRDDSLYLFYGLLEVETEYAEGYLGQQAFEIGPETVPFDFLNALPGNNIGIDVEDLEVNLVIANGVGAPGEVTIKNLVAKNTKSGISKKLTGSVIGDAITIAPATDNPLTPANTAIPLNKSNSNILELLEILPDELTYEAEIQINPQGNDNNYSDFIYDNSVIRVGLDIEMPLSFKNSTVAFTDTFDFNTLGFEDASHIKAAKLILKAENKFPLQGDVGIYLLDDWGTVLDSIFTSPDQVIEAGIINAQGQVTNPVETRLTHIIPPDKINVLQNASKAIVKFSVTTSPQDQYLKIYSSYFLDVKLLTDFTYLRSNE